MVYVPAGEFLMGCDLGTASECTSNEEPPHKVYLNAFYVDKYEVTMAQYQACVSEGKCKPAHLDDGLCVVYNSVNDWKPGKAPQSFKGAQQPVLCVDWDQSKAYCEWAGKRLPTEAEWEKAARGTDGRIYPWGNEGGRSKSWGKEESICGYAVGAVDLGKELGCGKYSTWPVGSKPKGASPFGAMDMAGNVYEWTADWYDYKYYKNSPSKNPTGPSSGAARVARGGSWCNPPYLARVTLRVFFPPAFKAALLGVRCVKNP